MGKTKTSPTQRSLKHIRKLGYTAQVVERFNPYAMVRIDLFGFGDIVATDGIENIIIQTTSYSNMSARRTKILEIPAARLWVKGGGRILLHGWKHKGKGTRWELKEEDLTLECLVCIDHP